MKSAVRVAPAPSAPASPPLRNERFEIGPTVGIGYLWLNARIAATGKVGGRF